MGHQSSHRWPCVGLFGQRAVQFVDRAGGQLLAEYKNGTTYFAHPDHLGSTRLVTALNQSVSDNLDFLPFGEQIAGSSGSAHKFTGDERDAETGLDHTWFRQYSSSLGRWMHPDPAGLAAVDPTNPQSLNRYAYVVNSPLNFVDPSGLVCSANIGNDGPDTVCNAANFGSGGGSGSFDGYGVFGLMDIPIGMEQESIVYLQFWMPAIDDLGNSQTIGRC
jgi:RHS repeat-associated protein